MKATGVVRNVDQLGRVVLPKELRKTMDIPEGAPMEIFVEEDKLILKKYEPACIFCGNADDVVDLMGKKICAKCLRSIKSSR